MQPLGGLPVQVDHRTKQINKFPLQIVKNSDTLSGGAQKPMGRFHSTLKKKDPNSACVRKVFAFENTLKDQRP